VSSRRSHPPAKQDVGGYRADFVRLVEAVRDRGLVAVKNER
jgi:hypothetical protein